MKNERIHLPQPQLDDTLNRKVSLSNTLKDPSINKQPNKNQFNFSNDDET